MEIQIPLRSTSGRFKTNGQPRLVNCYAREGGNDLRSPFLLVPTTGLKQFGGDMSGPCRGMIFLDDLGLIYSVQGFALYKTDKDGVNTRLQSMPDTGPVFFARNDAEVPEITLVVGEQMYVIKGDDIALKVDLDFAPKGVTFIGGYFVSWDARGRLYLSELRSAEFTSLRFATAESNPDGLTFCYTLGDNLYAVGQRTTEVWAINGGASFPLSKVVGAYLNTGSLSPHSPQDINQTMFFIDNDGVVQQASGYQIQKVSTDEVTRLIRAEEDISSIVCFSYINGDDKFYTIYGSTWCKEYNATTGLWHDRVTGINDRWRAVHHVRAWNKDLFGDSLSGYLLEADAELFTEVNEIMTWGFDTSTIHAGRNTISFNSMWFLAETGDGQSLSDDGKLMLSYSDDGGRTFKGNRQLSLGKTGEYNTLVETYGLGQSERNGRIFRTRITDPVIRSITAIEVDAEPVQQ